MKNLLKGKIKATIIIPIVVFIFLIQTSEGLSQWSGNPYTNNQVCTEINNQGGAVICSDGNGGAIIAWSDTRNDWGDIYAQRFDSSGIALWAINGIPICIATSLQGGQLAMVSDGNGGAIITWVDFRNEIDPDIFAQRVNGIGEVQWTAGGVGICMAPDEQTYPVIASDEQGGAIFTWTDWRNRATSGTDIFAQSINANGTLKWQEVAVCTNIEGQLQPAILSDDNGGAFVVWKDGRNASDGTSAADIYAQHISSDGLSLWTSNGWGICKTFRTQENPKLTSDGSGGAIVTWQDERNLNDSFPNNIDIYAQRIAANGEVQWAINGIAICNNKEIQEFEQITSVESGGAIIAWENVSGSGISATTKVYVQRIDNNGSALWMPNGVPIGSGGTFPKVVSDGTGGGIVFWEQALGGGLTDIYAQHIDPNGLELWSPFGGVVVSNAYGSQTSPQGIYDDTLGTILTWTDTRNTNLDVYAQHIQPDGSLGGGNVAGSQIITFNPIPGKKYSDGIFVPDAIASSGLAVTFTSSDTTVAQWSGSYIYITGVGTTTITAYQAGNANYNAATPVSQDLIVIKGSQTINFFSVDSKTLGDAPFELNALAGSLLPVEFSTTSEKISLNGSEVTMLEAGSVTIYAEQTGDANYEAAQTAVQSFCINPPKPAISKGQSDSILISYSETANHWYQDGVLLPGETNDTLIVSVAGIYTIKISADNCYSETSNGINPFDTIPYVNGIFTNPTGKILIYPNPVTDILFIDVSAISLKAPVTVSLLDLSGRTLETVSGENRFSMNLANYNSSVYLIKISNNDISTVRRIIKR